MCHTVTNARLCERDDSCLRMGPRTWTGQVQADCAHEHFRVRVLPSVLFFLRSNTILRLYFRFTVLQKNGEPPSSGCTGKTHRNGRCPSPAHLHSYPACLMHLLLRKASTLWQPVAWHLDVPHLLRLATTGRLTQKFQ